MFDLAIDSKVRSCDIVKLEIGDLVSGGRVRSRAIVDPQTRETYGEHLTNVGSGLRDTVGSTVDLAGAPVRAMIGGH